MRTVLPAFGLVWVLASCGGGGTSVPAEVDVLRAQAMAKESAARALAVDQPCATDGDCGGLQFGPTDSSCLPGKPQAYSLVPSSARQAEAEAAQQRSIASQIMSMLPSTVCPLSAVAPPIAACESNKCVLK